MSGEAGRLRHPDNYVVRVYRRDADRSTLHGVVEVVKTGKRFKFRCQEELWHVLWGSLEGITGEEFKTETGI